MQFSPLIEYNVRNIFLQKSYTKSSGETTRKPFSPLILWHDFNDFMKKCLRQSFVVFWSILDKIWIQCEWRHTRESTKHSSLLLFVYFY